MPDVLILNVPAADLARLDAQAAQLGISLDEYLRRHLHQEACRLAGPVTTADLQAVTDRIADVSDVEVMRAAWS